MVQHMGLMRSHIKSFIRSHGKKDYPLKKLNSMKWKVRIFGFYSPIKELITTLLHGTCKKPRAYEQPVNRAA